MISNEFTDGFSIYLCLLQTYYTTGTGGACGAAGSYILTKGESLMQRFPFPWAICYEWVLQKKALQSTCSAFAITIIILHRIFCYVKISDISFHYLCHSTIADYWLTISSIISDFSCTHSSESDTTACHLPQKIFFHVNSPLSKANGLPTSQTS